MRLFRCSAVPGVIFLLCLLATACASAVDKNVAYRDSRSTRPLTIPADLDAPATDQRLEIPATGPSAGASDVEVDARPPNIVTAPPTP
jgi:uncharacterized lipoprotein